MIPATPDSAKLAFNSYLFYGAWDARSLRKHGVKAYFVPMPQPRHWALDPAAVAVIRENGAHLIDGRSIPGMVESEFSDGYHLAETGRTRFTRFLASRLSDELSTTAAPSP